MAERIRVGAWLPNDWGQHLPDKKKQLITESDIDLLLIPENHDQWENRGQWKRVADELEIAVYAGFEDGDWIRGIFYDAATDTDFTYTKHSTADKITLEQDNWRPEIEFPIADLRGTNVGPTICHDHYISLFMRYEGLLEASLLVNLSARPVVSKKWGEVLQARAIENGAYVVCTMHGTERDGSIKRGNKASVFAFDPFGDPLNLTELETNHERSIFETAPDNIYTFQVDPDRAKWARRTLVESKERPEISRIRESTSESSTLKEPWFRIDRDNDSIRVSYDSESIEISDFESQSFSLGDEDFFVVVVPDNEILKPERLYREILSEPNIKNKRLILLNHWSDLDHQHYQNVIEPVIRARCIEWASPALVITPKDEFAYQVWYAKNTSRMIPDTENKYRFYLHAARGVSSALKPVNCNTERLLQLAKVCENRRSKSDLNILN